jgi:3-hydroxyacyl-[acyl-carrier-protein] dehydratase
MSPIELGELARPLEAVDAIVHRDEAAITTVKAVSGSEPFCAGHYPGFAIYPGVFVLETVHQSVLQHVAAGGADWREALLREIRSARFLAPLRPGHVLRTECRCSLSADGTELKVRATCRNAERVSAELRLVYAIGERR